MLSNHLIFGTGLSAAKDYASLQAVVTACLERGICAFDTAPSYGTERVLGEILSSVWQKGQIPRSRVWVQDKVDAWQMQEGGGDVTAYVQAALKQMQLSYFDAVLIHWPIPAYFDDTYASLQKLKDRGDIRHVGVCNVRVRQLDAMTGNLPDIIQIERNPLNTFAREAALCAEKQILLQDYSPLCKFHRDISESEVLRGLAAKYRKSIGQVVMRWHLDTGASPIFTTQKPDRVAEYADIFDFSLSADDVRAINGLNRNYKMYLESIACPGF